MSYFSKSQNFTGSSFLNVNSVFVIYHNMLNIFGFWIVDWTTANLMMSRNFQAN